MIPLSVPNLSGKELEYVKECIETGWISTAGSFVDRFENEFADYLGLKESVSVVNGTAALHLALQLLNVNANDLVIMPNITFVASANAISYRGAEPLLVDIDKSNWQMDLSLLEDFLQNRCHRDSSDKLLHSDTKKNIAALMIVHVQGNICDMDRLIEICRKYKLPVIEDAAEALGSVYKEKFAGTIGDIGCYSFNGNKIISTGGGGMIVARRSDLMRKAKHLSTTAKKDSLTYFHDEVGYNYRLVNVLAAIGVAQLEQLEKFVEKKINIANFYRKNLEGIGDIQFQKIASDVISNEWLFTLTTESMNKLLSFLNENGVMSRPFWVPMNQLPMYKDCLYISDKNVSDNIHRKALSIPCSTGISRADMTQVSDMIIKFFNK